MGWYLPCAENLRAQPNWSQWSLLALQSLKCSTYRRTNCSCFFQDFFQASKVDEQLSNISKITSTSNTTCHLYVLSQCVVSSTFHCWVLLLGFIQNFFCICTISIYILLLHPLEAFAYLDKNSPVLGLPQNRLVYPKSSVLGSLSKVQWILLCSKYRIVSCIWKPPLVLLKCVSIIEYYKLGSS